MTEVIIVMYQNLLSQLTISFSSLVYVLLHVLYSSFLLLARRALFFPRFRLHVLRLAMFFVNFMISFAFTYFAYLWVRFILNLQNWPTDNSS